MSKHSRIRITQMSNESDKTQNDNNPPATAHRYEINPFEIGRLLVNKRNWIFGVILPVMFLTAVKMFTTPNVYQSGATILPSGNSDELSSIRELVELGGGINIGNENSSALYPLILNSNLIKDSILNKEYNITFKGETKRIILSEYFGRQDPTRLRKNLAGITAISANRRSGEIYVSVETEYPELSQAMLTEYLRQLEYYNSFVRKSSARENQRYLEKRLIESNVELAKAENDLRSFRETNSNWAVTTNADILHDLTRLERNLQVKTSANLFLQQQYEMAGFNAQKDIPIIRVLDQPSLPTIKSGPKRVITIILAGMISFMLTVMWIFFADLWRQGTSGKNRHVYESLQQDFSEAFPRSKRVLNFIRRKRHAGSVESEEIHV